MGSGGGGCSAVTEGRAVVMVVTLCEVKTPIFLERQSWVHQGMRKTSSRI